MLYESDVLVWIFCATTAVLGVANAVVSCNRKQSAHKKTRQVGSSAESIYASKIKSVSAKHRPPAIQASKQSAAAPAADDSGANKEAPPKSRDEKQTQQSSEENSRQKSPMQGTQMSQSEKKSSRSSKGGTLDTTQATVDAEITQGSAASATVTDRTDQSRSKD
ncbi:hypothetical protein L596_015980 [Steinernema carpocapsae]|uniref:Uncharacterized protein n=1 Tax=Steinernema carpocapsae TaxID=34508 RepID=A0A4V6A392_STECR|nr:hypothetical protein L596_015980 [Steinernema carpocapsae]